MNKKDQELIRKKISQLQKHLIDQEDKEIEKSIKGIIGKCFVSKNNYSCPEKPSDYWNLYIKIIKIDGRNVYSEQIQKDKYGTVTYDPNTIGYYNRFVEPHNYQTITRKQYDAAKKRIVKSIGE